MSPNDNKKHNFLFINLGEEQATEISQAIANKTAQKVLDELKRGHATESELSSRLSIPLSTIHYNTQQLVKAGLVVGDQYHYSVKGREVSHYRLTNKVIVISPQKTEQFEALVKTLTPVILIIAAGTAFVSYLGGKLNANILSAMNTASTMAAKSAITVVATTPAAQNAGAAMIQSSAQIAPSAAIQAANDTLLTTTNAYAQSATAISEPHYAFLFFVGSIAIAAVSLLGIWLWNKYRN